MSTDGSGDALGLDPDEVGDRNPFELSGGQQRRVAFAGVLVTDPQVLVLDEPTAGLDAPSWEALFLILHHVWARGLCVLWVSHRQALWMLQSVRDVVVGLDCQRLGLPQAEARGVDRLPADLLDGLVRTHASRVEPEPLTACFETVMRLLLEEAERHGVHVSADLAGVVVELARPEQGPTS